MTKEREKEREKEKPIISKITIEIGDSKAAVTLDQARKLHAALSEMFGAKEKETIYVDRYRDWSWPWNRPFYTYCGASDNTTLSAYAALDSRKALGIEVDTTVLDQMNAMANNNLTLRIE